MTQAVTTTTLKITEQQPSGWRQIGSPGWQYAWMNHLTESGIWASLTGGQQGVLWVLLSRANTEGICWPVVPTLMQLSGQGERSVQGALKRFEKLGLITINQPDQRCSHRYFEFTSWTAWSTPPPETALESMQETTPQTDPQPKHEAHTGAHEAHTHAPTSQLAHTDAPQAHTGAPQAHTGAPQAHTGAPQAHTHAPLIYRNLNRRDEEESSSSSNQANTAHEKNTPAALPPAATPISPAGQAPPDMLTLLDDDTPGLFDDQAVAMMLTGKQFPQEQAHQLVRTYGNRRVREAIANTEFRDAKGEIHTNPQAFLVGFLKSGYTLDRRITTQAQAAKRREKNQQAKAVQQASMAPARRLSPDAQIVAAKGSKLFMTQDEPTKAQQHAHAWQQLQDTGDWDRQRFDNAIKDLEATA